MLINQIRLEIKNIKTTSFGISIPELKKFAQQIAKENYKEVLDNNKYETFEMKLLHAFVLGYAKDNIETLLKYFDNFIPYVDNWAVNDSLCQSFKIARHYPDTVWKYLMNYQNTNIEFESRIVSVMLLSHFLTDEYINKVITVLDKLNAENYYAQMGIAWAIATIMGKYPQVCLQYLQSDDCHLNDKTFNKSVQKICESLRVSENIKEKVKKLKRAQK
ncbi:MAG: DNA alkylation repair protein [Alphaproteobacteria bacterium]|nr:DNA alkylation repair protein [Alphaproteobacteria bacterium]